MVVRVVADHQVGVGVLEGALRICQDAAWVQGGLGRLALERKERHTRRQLHRPGCCNNAL